MSNLATSTNQFAAHAVCMAASARDVMRTAQFYTRDMSNVDGANKSERAAPTLLSSLVTHMARLADRFMNWSSTVAIKLFLPTWRKLPSPFEPGLLTEVASAIAENSLVHNPLFNSYFFRAAKHITQRYCDPPCLILEHRVDAARGQLAQEDEFFAIFGALITPRLEKIAGLVVSKDVIALTAELNNIKAIY